LLLIIVVIFPQIANLLKKIEKLRAAIKIMHVGKQTNSLGLVLKLDKKGMYIIYYLT